MIGITIDDKRINKLLLEASRALGDMTPAFQDIADLELKDTELRFLDQKAPDGTKWEDPFTIRSGTGPETGSGARTLRSPWPASSAWSYVVASNYHATPPGWRFWSKSQGDKVLRDTGTLFNSIGRAFGPSWAVVGTNVEYARKHQEGLGVKRRVIFGITKNTLDNVESSILRFWDRQVKR